MKKIIALLSLVAILATFYTFQSCTRELISNQPTVESLIRDEDFQKFSASHWKMISQVGFYQASYSGEERAYLLKRLRKLSAGVSGMTAENTSELMTILGFENLDDLNVFFARYVREFNIVKEKFVIGSNFSEIDAENVIFSSYVKYSFSKSWKIKKDKKGYYYALGTLNIRNRGTVQLRSCEVDNGQGECNFQDCDGEHAKSVAEAQRELNRDLGSALGLAATGGTVGSVIPLVGTATGTGLGAIVGLGIALLNFNDAVDEADNSKCECIKRHKESCPCN
jgi:hypothetical protein